MGKRTPLVDRRHMPFTGAVAMVAIMAAVLVGTLAAKAMEPGLSNSSLDAYKMASDCVAGQPAYETADGRLWAWQDGWAGSSFGQL